MDYLDLMFNERSYEDLVAETEARFEFEREEAQLKYLEEKENKNEYISKN